MAPQPRRSNIERATPPGGIAIPAFAASAGPSASAAHDARAHAAPHAPRRAPAYDSDAEAPTGLPIAFLRVGGLLMAALGVMYVVSPTQLAVEGELLLESAAARTEIRAVYGGFMLAIGAFMLWGAQRHARVRPALVLAGTIAAGAALGRAFGYVAEGELSQAHVIYGAIELAGALAAYALQRGLNEASPA